MSVSTDIHTDNQEDGNMFQSTSDEPGVAQTLIDIGNPEVLKHIPAL